MFPFWVVYGSLKDWTQPKSAKINQNQPKSAKIRVVWFQGLVRLEKFASWLCLVHDRIKQNQPKSAKSAKISQNQPNQPKSAKISQLNQNQPKSTKINQNQPKSAKISSPKFLRRHRAFLTGTEIISQVPGFLRRFRDFFAGTEIFSQACRYRDFFCWVTMLRHLQVWPPACRANLCLRFSQPVSRTPTLGSQLSQRTISGLPPNRKVNDRIKSMAIPNSLDERPGFVAWFGGFHKWGIYGLFRGTSYENGCFRGTTISGNLHFVLFVHNGKSTTWWRTTEVDDIAGIFWTFIGWIHSSSPEI